MTDETKDVNSTDSSNVENQETVESTEVGQSSVDQTAQAEGATVNEAPNLDPNIYDPTGVPWKNRFYEKERKFSELTDNLPKMIEEKLSATKKETPKEYTIADLESYALQYPEKRPWVEEEKAKLIAQNSIRLFTQQMEAQQAAKKAEETKKEAYNYVAKNYPEVLKKDTQGRVIGFDDSNPLMQEIGALYASTPDLHNRPDGFSVAADIAYGRYVRSNKYKQDIQTKKVISEKKKLESKVLPEGGGKAESPSESPRETAMDRLKKSGRQEDAQDAIAEILRAKGVFK